MTLPSRIGGPTTQEVGFFEIASHQLATWLVGGLDANWVLGPKTGWSSIGEAIVALRPNSLISRYACVPIGRWSLILNDGPSGTDLGVLPSQGARELRRRAIRAVCVADDEPGYPARVLEVFGPEGKPPLAIERSIVAAKDGGRWVFETTGASFEFEDPRAYSYRTISERFTCELLHQYLRLLGVPIDTEPDWSSSVLVERR